MKSSKSGEEGMPATGGCCGGGDKNMNKDESRPPEKDIDPVCGKTVMTGQAKTSLHDGLIYFFCSSACRETFEQQPSQYTSPENPSSPQFLEDRKVADPELH